MSFFFLPQRSATKAVVVVEPGQSMENGFQLLIGLAEIHVPRMWVERHTTKPDSQVSGNIISSGQSMRQCPVDESYKDQSANPNIELAGESA